MLIIGGEEAHRRLDWRSTVAMLRTAHCGAMPVVGRLQMMQPQPAASDQPDVLLALGAWQAEQVLGVKLVTSFPRNETLHGKPTVHATYALFSGITGELLALIDGEALTARKTAADSALGSALLAKPEARILLMLGAGFMAPHLIAAHRALHPGLTTVLVWNRNPARAERLVESLREEGVPIERVEDLSAAFSEADIVSAATMATEPLIQGERLKPGCHVDLVGSFTPEMREADDEVFRRGSVFVDSWSCVDRCGEIVKPLVSKALDRNDIRGDLFDLCKGRCRGRRDGKEITVFKNGGGGHLDLFVARYLYELSTSRPSANTG